MGPEIYIVLGVIVLLFGGSQLPKLARSLGQAKKEFEGGQRETSAPAGDAKPTKPAAEAKPSSKSEAVADDEQA
jgi:sec-independent protein translocase protein TatA